MGSRDASSAIPTDVSPHTSKSSSRPESAEISSVRGTRVQLKATRAAREQWERGSPSICRIYTYNMM